ncbi:MAG TPA: hypothetical protein VEF53_07890 [Patescibacteria group bacterium]|nr:hypothetical protein [Patescibacteria group bacterium]
MQRLFNKRYYIAFILSLCLFFAAIVSLHSYYNLQRIIQPASDLWARTTSLGSADLFKKQPSIIVNDKYTEVLTANKSNFTHMRIDRITRETTKETINLKGVESYKVQKFDWDEDNIYFIESNNLYFVTKNPAGGYSAKTKIEDEVKDFDVVNSKEEVILAAAQNDGIVLYRLTANGFQKFGTKYNIDKISNLAVVKDNKGIIHIAAYAEVSAIDFPVYYLVLQDENWSLIGTVTERSLSESWSINDIDIGVDDTDAYIFYEMVKWDKFGISAKTYNAVVPLYTNNIDFKFNRFYISEEDGKNSDAFLSEPQMIKGQDNQLRLTLIKDTYDKKYGNGFSGYYVTMDNGKVVEASRVTKNHRLISNTTNGYFNGSNIFIFLDAAGGFNYEAFYTETGSAYYENSLKPTKDDLYVALIDTIPGYVSTIIVSFIKLTLYFPVIIWFLIIEFFEIRRLKNKPKLTYTIGFILYLIMKVATFGGYYTALSISQMPSLLTFAGAKYFYAVLFAVLALLIQKLLKKHNQEMHLITEFIIFALIDIEFTNLLYATYMV